MEFITEDFLLQNETASHLFKTYAVGQPIIDYHCHLSPKDIAEDRRFNDLFEIWLEGDHYKWRAMRANGVPEKYCTGDVSPYEKFQAWARTVPYTLRNPLYHWTHLELERHFGINELLDESSARRIWDAANDELRNGELTARGILTKFNVAIVCTTDDPTDSLEYHKRMAEAPFGTCIYPAFRPDRVLRMDNVASFRDYVHQLAQAANIHIARLSDLLDALDRRHAYFHENGCRLSDHGLEVCFADFPSEAEANAVFDKLQSGRTVNPSEATKLASYLLLFFGHLDAKRGWTKQLHLGALRNANNAMLPKLGRDTGFDSIGDWPQAEKLARYLSRLDEEGALPKLIIYNANPADNYAFATMIGNFQDGSVPGKLQFGSGWWFLDQKEAIEWQINALSNCGLLSHFVGMLTDSRSFMSYPRHEYFRRVLCNMIGREIESGELPDDEKLIGRMIKGICYRNAEAYFGLPAGQTVAPATTSSHR